jgi:deoxyhypusine synthase
MKNAPPSVFFESPARRFRAVVLLNPFLQAIPVYTISLRESSFGIHVRSLEKHYRLHIDVFTHRRSYCEHDE